MKKVLLLSLTALMIFTGQVWADDMMKADVAMKKPELIAAKTPQEKLTIINTWIEQKKMRSSTLSDYVHRLWWEAIADATTIKAKIEKYAGLKKANPKISTDYDFEKTLIMMYLSEDPEAKAADDVTKMKLIKRMQEGKKISWPAAAPFYTTLIAYHASKNPEFQKMSAKDKIMYLKRLETEGAYGSISSSPYLKGIAISDLVTKTGDGQKNAYVEYVTIGGFFTKSALQRAFQEYKQ